MAPPVGRLREKDITNMISNYARRLGAYVFKVHGHLGQRRGVPDLLICLRGRFIAIEVKTPRGRVSPYQEVEIRLIKEAGGVAEVARSFEEGRVLLDDALEEARSVGVAG